MTGLLPTILQVTLLGLILSLLQWLHGVVIAWYAMLVFGLGVLATVCCWLVSLISVHASLRAEHKRAVALKLSLLLIFAFSMTFIMIFMYHWLNEDGHVHGASASQGGLSTSGLTIGTKGIATVYSDVHLRGYRLPIQVQLNHHQLELMANKPKIMVLKLVNQADHPVNLRLAAKLAPGAAKHMLDYALLHHDELVTLGTGETKVIDHAIRVNADFPVELQPLTLTHFVFGQDDPSAWEKMQGPLLGQS